MAGANLANLRSLSWDSHFNSDTLGHWGDFPRSTRRNGPEHPWTLTFRLHSGNPHPCQAPSCCAGDDARERSRTSLTAAITTRPVRMLGPLFIMSGFSTSIKELMCSLLMNVSNAQSPWRLDGVVSADSAAREEE